MSELLETLGEVLTSPIVIELLAAVVAAVWALPRVQQWRRDVEVTRWRRLLRFAEHCVVATHHSYVEKLKRAREDGKLTVEEARNARQEALRRLFDALDSNAPDLAARYSTAVLKTAIEKAHGWLQNEGAL